MHTMYECPRCNKEAMFLEVNSIKYKFLLACGHCCFYGWVDHLKEKVN